MAFTYDDLFFAIYDGDTLKVKEIIKSGFDVTNMDREETDPEAYDKDHSKLRRYPMYGKYLLSVAAACKNMEIIKLLLKAGANPNFSDGEPLHEALFDSMYRNKEFDIEIVKLLVESGACVNLFPVYSSTPIALAVMREDAELVDYLLQKGADINLTSSEHETPLFLASKAGNVDIVRLLIEAGADVNKPNTDGLTPLHIAAAIGHTFVVAHLVKGKANLFLKTHGDTGITAIDLAKILEKDRVVEMLEIAMAHPGRFIVC